MVTSSNKSTSRPTSDLQGGFGDNTDDPLSFVGEADEVGHNRLIWEGLSLTEAYHTGKLEFCFPFGGCGKAPQVAGFSYHV